MQELVSFFPVSDLITKWRQEGGEAVSVGAVRSSSPGLCKEREEKEDDSRLEAGAAGTGLSNAAECWVSLGILPHLPQASGGNKGAIPSSVASQPSLRKLQDA